LKSTVLEYARTQSKKSVKRAILRIPHIKYQVEHRFGTSAKLLNKAAFCGRRQDLLVQTTHSIA